MSWQIEQKRTDKFGENKGETSSDVEYLVYAGDGQPHTLAEAHAAFTQVYNHNTLRDAWGNKPSEFTFEEEEGSSGSAYTARVKFASIPDEKKSLGREQPWWFESFDTGGGTAHCTFGYDERVLAFDPADRDIPRFDGGIGWNGESFEGCDIIVPALSFTGKTRTKYHDFTQAQAEWFAMQTGAINNADFCGFARHCVQCRSVKGNVIFLPKDALTEDEHGNKVGAMEPWYEFTCEFAVQPWVNVTVSGAGVTPSGRTIPGFRYIRKNGYDYLWVLWQSYDDQISGMTLKKPKAIYVNQVYPDADFSRFGLHFFNSR